MSQSTVFEASPQKHLISRSSIFILGGALIGSTLNEAFRGDGLYSLNFLSFLAALVALLAFIGLEAVSRRRKRLAEQRKKEVAAQILERRVDRHLVD